MSGAGLDWHEVGVERLQAAFGAGELTSLALVRALLQRVAALDRLGPALHVVIELNPDAEAIAAERDRERRGGLIRGPLHGIPVLLKDNIDTADRMQTTAGSLALVGEPAPRMPRWCNGCGPPARSSWVRPT